ncbi:MULTISPECIES: metallopeptidase family protein [unclassified Frankia]|uniref:metallopeptidase family protein n=1 Tax=unclassified Frankia TaxID=2632575 RepID=UPI001EF4DD04|nr:MULTISPECIES: metallopeptidase family protein [unclassified Frankia]
MDPEGVGTVAAREPYAHAMADNASPGASWGTPGPDFPAAQPPIPVSRRRDRRGRGLRGALLPPEVPAYRSRGERFDDLVLDAVEHLEHRWSAELSDVEFAVEDVPPLPAVLGPDEPVPLAHHQPPAGRGRSATPHRIIIYRRPLEARAMDTDDLAELILDVLIHKVADMLGVEPEVIDPEGHGWHEDE